MEPFHDRLKAGALGWICLHILLLVRRSVQKGHLVSRHIYEWRCRDVGQPDPADRFTRRSMSLTYPQLVPRGLPLFGWGSFIHAFGKDIVLVRVARVFDSFDHRS